MYSGQPFHVHYLMLRILPELPSAILQTLVGCSKADHIPDRRNVKRSLVEVPRIHVREVKKVAQDSDMRSHSKP